MHERDLQPFVAIDRIVSGVDVLSPEDAQPILHMQHAAGPPGLCRRISQSLLSRPGSRVLLVTGFVVPDLIPQGENDGPLGTLALARALDLCGFNVHILVDPALQSTLRWLAAEIGVTASVDVLEPRTFPRWVEKTHVAFAIEKPAANECGVLHTFDGHRIEGGSIPVDSFFVQLRAAECLTIGIGDRGNEIGLGSIRDCLASLFPHTARCTCPCGGSTLSATATSFVYPCAVSNWGAYGIVAALALLTGRSEILVDADEERRWLHVTAVRGCRDGVRRRGAYGVDGLHGDDSALVVSRLSEVVRKVG